MNKIKQNLKFNQIIIGRLCDMSPVSLLRFFDSEEEIIGKDLSWGVLVTKQSVRQSDFYVALYSACVTKQIYSFLNRISFNVVLIINMQGI